MDTKGLIVGLGNPGKEYESTRHNIGFMVIDQLIHNVPVHKISGGKFSSDIWEMESSTGLTHWFLMKPQTYMNASGDAITPFTSWYNIPTEQILIIHDELDLPLGRMKFKQDGGTAGHNGLKSIMQRLGTTNFCRLRIGIGRSPYASHNTIRWVLGRFSQKELEIFQKIVPNILRVVSLFVTHNITAAQTVANSFTIDTV